jgi:hypothetical protein
MYPTVNCPYCERDRFGTLDPQKVKDIVGQIPIAPSLCSDAASYKARLVVCDSCESLRGEVLCAYCGCFVLFRARPIHAYCPHPEGDRWKGISETSDAGAAPGRG